jgi:hypothetical protein
MTEKTFIERFHRVMKIAPQESTPRQTKNSWNCNLLTTEQKIYAISNGYSDIESAAWIKQKNNEKRWKQIVEKWMKKCPWKVPFAMVVVSFIQVRNSTIFS